MAETNPFGFKLRPKDDTLIADPDIGEEYVTAPKNMEPEIAKAFKELDEARSRLLRGHYKAAVACACDAVNRIAAEKDIHGYATY